MIKWTVGSTGVFGKEFSGDPDTVPDLLEWMVRMSGKRGCALAVSGLRVVQEPMKIPRI